MATVHIAGRTAITNAWNTFRAFCAGWAKGAWSSIDGEVHAIADIAQ